MENKTETGQAISAKDYGVRSRYYLRKDVKTSECVTVKPADPAKLAAYKAAHPEEFTEKAIAERQKALRNRIYNDERVCGV